MKLISAIVCSAAAVGACVSAAGAASATDVHCDSAEGRDITLVDGRTACRAAADDSGHARAAGLDGVGYAKATAGATALGVGAAGGIGASEGAAGLPVAIGLGPDAYAFTSLGAAPAGERVGITVALNGSRAQLDSREHTVACLGSAAVAWDSHSGAGCLATPVGLWRTAAAALP
ncbi:DUF6764 family protein [Nocardia blacklockiae]|uniref:DUF6764 family protein n=1 Tax=Nocardia blacklockiae TaxID=480036 RepID=UPI00189390D1|nr:DUF6764 family protein [Nocardia blacklockiae]MBF6176108.1 hypothetical protein [Nocardia blacklockiae]